MLNTPPTNPALNDLLTYLQKVSVLGGRDRLDFRRRGSGPAHLWLPEMVAGKAASVAELTTGGWTSFDLPGVRDVTDPVRLCYDTLG